MSPLLYLSGLCDPPFKVRGEVPIEIQVEEGGEVLSGRIDALVLRDRFWLLLAESKQTRLSFSVAIPQALTYMMGSANQTDPLFGVVTNGLKGPLPWGGRFQDDIFVDSRQAIGKIYTLQLKPRGCLSVGLQQPSPP